LSKKHFLKLRGAVAEKGTTMGNLAKELNITPQGLTLKLQGKTQFTLEEMIKSCNYLEAPIDIFFDPELHNLQFKECDRTA
jgi:transcriptional regulator with XRE-family HTH domain